MEDPAKEVPEVDRNVFKLAANGDVAAVRRLSSQGGFDVDARDITGFTALTWAARNGHVEMMKLLLDAGASIEATSPGGMRPAHHACNYSREDALLLLIQRGADMNVADDAGNTPLHWSVRTRWRGCSLGQPRSVGTVTARIPPRPSAPPPPRYVHAVGPL